MIKSFQHKGLKAFFETGSKSGIKPEHAKKLKRLLARLDISKTANDVNLPGWKLHLLDGDLSGYYSIVVNGNWRIIFKFKGEDVILVNYLDYH
jgi:proteic killer suppression protein